MNILGISAFYHDSAAALVQDGEIVAAAQEERFTRVRHDSAFPAQSVKYCLEAGGVTLKDIDHVVFYDKPFLKFERLLETYLAFAPRGFRSFAAAFPVWSREKLFQREMLRDDLARHMPGVDVSSKLMFTEHHQSHAASAFYPSPFKTAAILTMDGVGEWTTTSAGLGDGNTINIHREIHFPHSLGLLYSAFTYYLGFKVNSGEYKVMGLAPYGEPKYAKLIRDHLIEIKPDGSFRLNLDYFEYCTGLRMTNAKFDKLFGAPPRSPEEPLTQREMDIAASIQAVTEEAVGLLVEDTVERFGVRNLCLAGGVALNCVANGKVLRSGKVDRLWIQPAAGDAGGAVGAALAAYHHHLGKPRNGHNSLNGSNGVDGMSGSLLGPAFDQEEIEARLHAAGARYSVLDGGRPDRGHRRCLDRPEGGRLVPGPHGVRAACARLALDPGRSARAGHAKAPQSQDQVPQVVPPVRAVGALRGRRRVVRARGGQPLHAAGGRRRRQAPPRHDRGAEGAVRHRQAQRAALRDPGRHARRLLGARANRASRDQPALPQAACRSFARAPAVRCWSTPHSTCAASPSCARPRTPSAASWAPSSTCSPSATASSRKSSSCRP